ncbi:MAG: CoA transferase [Pseudolabrys sp.]
MVELLQGIRIVEASSFVAAPLCGLTFQQLGADVIRIDPIGGGPDFHRWPLAPSGLSFYWEGLNKGKRSIAIDLGRPEGRELAAALVTRAGGDAGCFITNYPAKGFLAHERLRALRRDLITLRIAGSSDGRNAVDYTVNCATGYPLMTGRPGDGRPVNHVLPAWDIATGLTAAVGLLAALHRRKLTGEGREIQVPLSNVAFGALSMLGNIGEASVFDKDRERYGNDIYGSFGRDFETADGRRIMVVAVTARQWRGLGAALDLQQEVAAIEASQGVNLEADDGARFTHRAALFALIESRIAARTLDDLAEAFDHHGACWGEYNSVRGALRNDPRLSLANPIFQRISHPSGETYLASGFPGIEPGAARAPVKPAPHLGSHTDEILAGELGLSDGEIARLHDAGLVAAADKTAEKCN